MSASVADGALWLQRARFFLTPLLRPVVALCRVTGRVANGSNCSVLVAGDSPTQRLLLAALLPQERREEPLGEVSLLRLPDLLRREMPRHDLVLARVPQILTNWGRWPGYLRMPAVVNMRVRADEVRRRRKLGRGTVASAYSRWRRHRFVAVPSRDRASFDLFYETMYLPFARTRFGEAAFIRDRRTLQRVLDRGAILWIEQDGHRVAARLVERDGDTLHAMSVGTSLDPAAAQANGILTAAKVAAVEFAFEAGLKWIDFGGCMPWLTDGVLLNKRHWGAELIQRRWLHQAVLAAWPCWTPAAVAFLALAPICRVDDDLHAVTTMNPRGQFPPHDLRVASLSRLWIVVDPAVDGVVAPSDTEEPIEIRLLTPGGSREILAQAGLTAGYPVRTSVST